MSLSGPFPPVADIQRIAEELALRGNGKLRAQVVQAWKANSCLGDLRQAADCVEVLRSVTNRERQEDTPDLLTIERSLLANALMLYARATSTNGHGGERGPIQLTQAKLSDEEWSDHCAILDVRNQAIAHVYKGRPLNDHNWHEGAFIAVKISKGIWKTAAASRQTSFHRATLERLERALPVAIQALTANFQKKMEAVTNVLNAEVKDSTFNKYLLDPIRTFGSPEAVAHLLASSSGGVTSYWYNEFNGGALEPLMP